MPWQAPIGDVTCIALDLETTGLAPGFDRITEVGAVRFRVRPDGVVVVGEVFERLVNPGRPIPRPIERLTGITNEDVADAPPIAAIWDDLAAFLAIDGPALLLAHNAAFDLGFLVSAASTLGVDWTGPPAACTVRIARRALPDAPRYGLETLVGWLGCAGDAPSHHRALADALHARNVFARCVAATASKTLGDLGLDAPFPVPSAADFELTIPDKLQPLQDIILSQRSVHISYRGGSKGRSRRPITPLGFYLRDEVMFLRAWCHVDDMAKSFRCDRIRGFDV